ncbi:site-specific integrase [Paenibacillus alvei]|uniref:Site-specific integrase n=1 Tax=Paenibacillus alvei TaxID=44250 RepID=A0ABT4H532_PAEAL|nr:site-specific integrase [Paenibacillus alvei]MCY9764103.1 site-specific integrase [Paenibacillus alvei]MCY9765561.1 site-specific integrase [Paenibacillus alvei]
MTVFKDESLKKNQWYYVIEIRENGKRKRVKKRGFKTKKEAEKAENEAQNRYNNGLNINASNMPLKSLLDTWLQSKEYSIKKVTYNTYQSHIMNHITPYIGNVELSKLTITHCQKIIKHLHEEKELSIRSVRDIFKTLKAALDKAVEWDMVTKNVAALVDLPKEQKKEVQVWTAEQIREFDSLIKNHREYVAFLLAYTTGMRKGEILGLRWKDVDLDARTISVVQAKTAAGNRLISIDDRTVAELKKRKIMMSKEKLSAGAVYRDNDLVIGTSVGTPISPRNILRTFERFLKKSELPEITIHDLRHTHASLLLKQGVHPKIVSERLGHSSIKITLDLYSHLLPNMQKETADQFGAMLFGTK